MNRQSLVVAGIWVLVLVLMSVIIPALLVDKRTDAIDGAGRIDDGNLLSAKRSGTKQEAFWSQLEVPVYLTKEERVEHVPLEAYVRGVVAAEMPPEFELEAMKAQAIAARTYIVRRLAERDFSQVPVQEAWVTDSVVHQAYLTIDQLKKRWGKDQFPAYWQKWTDAVRETAGLIATYEGEPILAAYFSTSNGYTENSEEYWQRKIPYLRSVPSPWDKQLSPRYQQTVTLGIDEFKEKLGLSDAINISGEDAYKVLEKTAGGRVKTARIGNQVLSGREIREKLELPSTHFSLRFTDQHVEVTTYGYGHGIGMSQYGAQGMALEGYKADEILKYFYTGIEIKRVDQVSIDLSNVLVTTARN